MHVVRRPLCFTSLFFRRTKFRGNMQKLSQMFCFRQNSDQFTARTFNDERFAEILRIRCRRFQIHKRYRRPKVRGIASSDHVTLREQLFRVAAEHGFHIFTKSKAANHVRVASADMPYRGAKFHGRGLKIYLCRLPASTGALNAAESYVKMKMFYGRC